MFVRQVEFLSVFQNNAGILGKHGRIQDQDDISFGWFAVPKKRQYLLIVFARIVADTEDLDPVQFSNEFTGNDLRADGNKVGRRFCVKDSVFHNCKTSVVQKRADK